MAQHEMADLNDTLVKASVKIDDGRDWSGWIVWDMRKNYRRSSGKYEPEPARPQVAPIKIEPKKKPRKRGHRVVQQAIGAV
ncbi:hypothetical protein [Pantoea vagans]|uniref:hypothetical protein n=1 Tax=Pantoea vagans TaxID=470934 RepID=UPI0023B0FB9C|nr:hypothetical protein [Pantoea vagans]MDE8556079.1 hypothetical protein [Pantoea vagans]MDE8576130.1 hypothetical protein [Pantoea vagans]